MSATAGRVLWKPLQRGIEAPVRRRFQLSTQGGKSHEGGDSRCVGPGVGARLEWRTGGSPYGWSTENRERALRGEEGGLCGRACPAQSGHPVNELFHSRSVSSSDVKGVG